MSKPAQKEVSIPLPLRAARLVLVVIHVVCPLMFFTNLTRNPYYTQIALLNVSIALGAILWAVYVYSRSEWVLPRVSFEKPLLIFIVAAGVSTVFSFINHPHLRSGLAFESARVWVFTLINCVVALYLPLLFTTSAAKSTRKISIWSDLIMTLIWGGLWFGYHQMKDPSPAATMFDPYGAFLWVLAIVYGIVRTKNGEILEIFHVVFAVSFIAGAYGVLQYQYAGRDIIWSSVLQPYGGRPVSTFGNPNFLSSYLLLVAPVSLALAIRAEGSQKWGYSLVTFITVLGILVTLTRSTYVGLVTSFVVMGALLFNRSQLKQIGIAILIFIGLVLLFPKTPLLSIQSPLARFTEVFEAIRTGQNYGPWHQRLLIWSSAWDMVQERLFWGKGWGSFELFYPFYQGKYLMTQLFAGWRTHANNAHNILMELWSQLGFIGTGIAIWLGSTVVWGGWKVFKQKEEGASRFLTAALLAGIVGMITDNFFGNVSIFFAVPAFLFWWNVGSLYNESSAPVLVQRPLLGWHRLLLAGFILLNAAGIFYFVKRWMQERYYFQGFKEAKTNLVVPSIKSLEKAYAWFPGDVNSNYELGNSYARHAKTFYDQKLIDQGRKFQEKSIGAYTAALKANPGYDEIYFNLGISYGNLGNTAEAIRNMEIALFINPLLRDAYVSLGNQYVNSGNFAAAHRVMKQAVAVFPGDEILRNNLTYVEQLLSQPKPK